MKLHANAKTTPHARALLVERVVHLGWTHAEAAEAAGVSLRTAFKWRQRFRDEGPDGLRDRSSTPHRSPNRTPHAVVRQIERHRRQRRTAEWIAERLELAISTVCLILKRLGLGRLRNLDPKPEPCRYERSRPGELIHIDTKKFAKISRIGHRIHGDRSRQARGCGYEFAHVCIDDATRLAYVEVLPDEKRESVIPFLKRAVAWFRRRGVIVEQLMTDNGPAYVSTRHAQLCSQLGIQHIRTKPYCPQTNGKAERFIQTLQREWAYFRAYRSSARRTAALHPWLREYNYSRPHRGIGRSTPNARLRSLR